VLLRSFTATLDEVARADHIDAVFDLKWAPAQHSASLTSAADGSPVAMLAMAGTSGEVSLHHCTADSVQCVAKVLHAPHPAQLHPANARRVYVAPPVGCRQLRNRGGHKAKLDTGEEAMTGCPNIQPEPVGIQLKVAHRV
jgi:hypothetical protein